MQTKVPVAACKRVAALTVVIQPGGPGDKDFAPRFFGVVDPLEQISPSSVLVGTRMKWIIVHFTHE